MPEGKQSWSLGSWVRRRILKWLFGENEPLVIEGDPYVNIPSGVELRLAGNAGSSGQVLKSRGVGQNPVWEAPKWSEVVIDVDKDMGGRRLTNVGAPSGSSDAIRKADLDAHRTASVIDHPDRSITRAKLEYPTENICIRYLYYIGKASVQTDGDKNILVTVDNFADKCVSADLAVGNVNGFGFGILIGRWVNSANYYRACIHAPPTTRDFYIDKYIAGILTNLAYEAVDLNALEQFTVSFSCSGSTLKAWRQGVRNLAGTPTLSVTDTSLTSGKWGARGIVTFCELLPAASPSPKPIVYFEVPIIGSGTPDDPFRAQLPEEVVTDWNLNPVMKKRYEILKARQFTDEEIEALFPEIKACRVNRLALTQSSLIKSEEKTGKPAEYTAIVRIFEQPDRQAHLRPIAKAVEALKSMKGVKELDRETAIKRAKQIDDKLHDFDLLLKYKPEKRDVKEYIDWRVHSLGVKEELIDENLMWQYVAEEKGW